MSATDPPNGPPTAEPAGTSAGSPGAAPTGAAGGTAASPGTEPAGSPGAAPTGATGATGAAGGIAAPPTPSRNAAPSHLTVDRPIATIMVVLAIAVFGFVSLQQLPVDLLPEISRPTITVRTDYPGAAPEDVEEAVSEPLEQILRTVEGVTEVSSVSRAGTSDVYLRFGWNADLDALSQRTRERVALVDLEDGVERPQILRYDPGLEPVMRLYASSSEPTFDLRRYAEDEVRPAIEAVRGVAMARVLGGARDVIEIDLDVARLAMVGLGVREVEDRLRAENLSVAGGQLRDSGRDVLVRTINELTTLDEIRAIRLATTGDAREVRLADVATIRRLRDRPDIYSTRGGQAAVEIEVFRESDANLVAVADAVRARLGVPATTAGHAAAGATRRDASAQESGTQQPSAADRATLVGSAPPGVELVVLEDQSRYIRAAIREVAQTALLGALCAVLVLLIFLRRLWPTVVIALSIPLSIIAVFAPLSWGGVSLNIMSLGGLALGVGMLVDNAIVVLEAIVRRRELGASARTAAISGVREVGGAVIASTLTTVAVFAPIVFVEGVAGQIFGDLALTVVLSLLASLAFALAFVPMLLARGGDRGVVAGVDAGGVPASGARSEGIQAGGASGAGPQRVAGLRSLGLIADDRDVVVAAWRGGGAGRRVFLVGFAPLLLLWWLARTALLLPLEVALVVLLGAALRGAAATLRRAVRLADRVTGGGSGRPATDADGVPAGWLSRAYAPVLRGALRWRAAVLVLAAAVLALGGWSFGRSGVELVPQLRQGQLTVELAWPPATPLEVVAREVRDVELAIARLPDVVGTSSRAGSTGLELEGTTAGRAAAQVRVQLASGGDVVAAEERAISGVRQVLAGLPGVSWEVTRPALVQTAPAIEVRVVSDDLGDLERVAAQVEARLRALPMIDEVRNRQLRGLPELQLELDRARLAQLGLSGRDVAEQIRASVRGVEATTVRLDGERLEVWVRGASGDDDALRWLLELPLPASSSGARPTAPSGPGGAVSALAAGLLGAGGAGGPVPPPQGARPGDQAVRLAAVVRVVETVGPGEIRHIRGRRTAVVEASAGVRDLAAAVRSVEQELASLETPLGVRVELAGQREDVAEAQSSLLFALGLAVFLVYVVMASRFESLVAPLIILLTVPLALAGVAIALVVAGLPISVVSLIGMIVLSGIVVNNAIVLVDYALQLLREGHEPDVAVSLAARVRLRPVLITTLTTVLGLLPMLLSTGEGAEIRQPLAFVVVTGLTSCTVLTLVVIPSALRAAVRLLPGAGEPGADG